MNIVDLFEKEAAGSGVYLAVMLILSGGGELLLLHIIRTSLRTLAPGAKSLPMPDKTAKTAGRQEKNFRQDSQD